MTTLKEIINNMFVYYGLNKFDIVSTSAENEVIIQMKLSKYDFKDGKEVLGCFRPYINEIENSAFAKQHEDQKQILQQEIEDLKKYKNFFDLLKETKV